MGGPTSDHPRTVIYDLDGVITYRDSFSALVVECLRRSPIRMLRAIPLAGIVLLGRTPERREQAARRIAEVALTGVGHASYAALAAEFGNRIGSDPTWIRTEVVDRIKAQHSAGNRIVIATATERQLAQALLSRAGVPYELLSASTLVETDTGMSVDDHRVGSRKTASLIEQSVPVADAEFVTDSLTDLPTARIAAHVILIGASTKTRRRYAREAITVVPLVHAPS